MSQTVDSSAGSKSIALCIDLDGTLLKTHSIWEILCHCIRKYPASILVIPTWTLKGRAYLKKQLTLRFSMDVSLWPFHEQLVRWLSEQKKAGQTIYLATGADQKLAEAVSQHFGFFSGVIASDGRVDRVGIQKATELNQRFGKYGYCYFGNSYQDLKVWESSHEGGFVGHPGRLLDSARQLTPIKYVFPIGSNKSFLNMMVRIFCDEQWSLLWVFATILILMGYKYLNIHSILQWLIAFFAVFFSSFAVCVGSDLMNVEFDRKKSIRQNRPFASGELSLGVGLIMVPLLAFCGIILGFLISPLFVLIILGYILIDFAHKCYGPWREAQNHR